MSQPDISSRRHSYPGLELIFNSSEVRVSTKRPRERSLSPALSIATNVDSGRELEPEEPLLSFSDLIRPLSATPSPEPSLHFGTPPRRPGPENIAENIAEGHEPISLQNQDSPSGEEDSEELVDDARVAEMRRTVLAWGLIPNESGPEQTPSSRERQLAMMIMALTHPARPTASQIAAQAEHIRSLLAERSVMLQQLEDLSEFRHADRLGFARTAQALNARATKSAKWNGSPATARETVYQDERSRNVELHVQNEKLNAENSRLEHELQDARREIAALKQSIEDLRVNLLIRPHTLPTSLQSTSHETAMPPTPNPRGRPRKYPLPSPANTQTFQAPTHSNPGAQLPVSSMSILNPNPPASGSTQPPPEKRMRATQPDARAELLLAAARRVGKDRVLMVLDGAEPGHPTKEDPRLNAEGTSSQSQQGNTPLLPPHSLTQAPPHESSPINGAEVSGATRRGRPPRASISFPTTAHHQFTQFLVDEGGKFYSSGYGRSSKLRQTKSAQEATSHTLESPKTHSPRRAQAQEVVVAFTGDPQVDAQACLASFVAQYPGIHPAPVWSTSKADSRAGLEDIQEPQASAKPSLTKAADPAERALVTPDRPTGDARSKGLEHLLTAARTVFRARSRSSSPTPTRQLTSNSALASPHHISTRTRHSPSLSHSRIASAPRRHSSPIVQPGDSDTEPEEPESPRSCRRVYSALDVLADQAAAVRTSSPDPPTEDLGSSPDLYERLIQQRSTSFPVTPESNVTLRVPVNRGLLSSSPATVVPVSDPSQFSSSSTSPSMLDLLDNQTRVRAPSEEPYPRIEGEIPESGKATENPRQSEAISHHPLGVEVTSSASGTNQVIPTPSKSNPGLRTPPRSEKSRGKQRAWGGSA